MSKKQRLIGILVVLLCGCRPDPPPTPTVPPARREILPQSGILEYGRTSIFEYPSSSDISSWSIEPSEGVVGLQNGGRFEVTPFIEGNYNIQLTLKDGSKISKIVNLPKNDIKINLKTHLNSYEQPFYINTINNVCSHTSVRPPETVCSNQKAIQIENGVPFGSRLLFITPDHVLKSGDIERGLVTNVKEVLRNVKQFSVNGGVALAIDNTNQVYSWGNGQYGQLGNGYRGYEPTPQKIDLKAARVIIGRYCSFAIDEFGTLYGWGRDPLMGDPNYVWDKPRKMMSGVVDVDGDAITLVLRNDKSVWSLGYGNPLGLSESNMPSKIFSEMNFISVDGDNALVASSGPSGEIFAWGSNKYNQIPGYSGDQAKPVNIRKYLPNISGDIVNIWYNNERGHMLVSNSALLVWGYDFRYGPEPYILREDVWTGQP